MEFITLLWIMDVINFTLNKNKNVLRLSVMVPYCKTDTETRLRVVFLLEQGPSCRKVSQKMHINVKTVYSIKKRREETGSVTDRARSGRPKKMTVRHDRALVRLSLGGRRLTSPQLRQKVEAELGVLVSTSTIRKRLQLLVTIFGH